MTNPKLVSGLGVLFCGDGLQLLLQLVRRIAANVAKLPELLGQKPNSQCMNG